MGAFFTELRRRNVFRVAGVYAVVGWLLIQVGYFREAEEIARASVAVDPFNVIDQNSLAWALSAQGRYQEALEIWDGTISRDETAAIVYPYTNSTRVMIVMGDYNAAADRITLFFERAIENEDERAEEIDSLGALRRLARGEITVDEALDLANQSIEYLAPALLAHSEDAARREARLAPRWRNDKVLELALFGVTTASNRVAFASDVWKQAVRDQGLLKLWRTRGFPYFCEALGEDDFQCFVDRVSAQ